MGRDEADHRIERREFGRSLMRMGFEAVRAMRVQFQQVDMGGGAAVVVREIPDREEPRAFERHGAARRVRTKRNDFDRASNPNDVR